jgi:hypothetical protein
MAIISGTRQRASGSSTEERRSPTILEDVHELKKTCTLSHSISFFLATNK